MTSRLQLSSSFKAAKFYESYRKEKKGYAKVRFLAMHHLQRGLSTSEVSAIVGYPRQTVWGWYRWFESQGLQRLSASPEGRGRKSKLSKSQEESLVKAIEALQAEHGGGRVNGVEITKHIHELWKVNYAPGSIYSVLKRLGIVWITGRSQHPQADPSAQEAFKK